MSHWIRRALGGVLCGKSGWLAELGENRGEVEWERRVEGRESGMSC